MENKMVRVPFDLELARKIDNKEIDGKIILSSGRKDLESSCSIAAIFEDIDYRIALNYNSGNGIYQIRCDNKGNILLDTSTKGINAGYIVELEIKDSVSIKNDRKDDKIMMDLLPWPELEEIAKVYTAGAKKYGPNKWQNLPDGYQRYKGAMLRHLTEVEKGNEIDQETGCMHMAQVAWNAIAMLHCKMEEMKPHSEKIPENANDIDK